MAKNLNWFQARDLAFAGEPIRRDAWRKWLEFDAGFYLWFIHQPAGVNYIDANGVQRTTSEDRHVVLNAEFQAAEFLANDWTDEPWDMVTNNNATDGSSGGDGSGSGSGSAGGGGGGSGGGSSSSGSGGGNNNNNNGGGAIIGSGSGGGGNFGPVPPPQPRPPGNGPPNNPPPPANADYTPTVTLTLEESPDGPACYINSPTQIRAIVHVEIPNPTNGKSSVLELSVTCLGQTQLGTRGPGWSGDFVFDGAINPGANLTATATASDFPGSWTGHDQKTAMPKCILVTETWSGSKDVHHSCHHTSQPDDGYDFHDEYNTTGQYAINPTAGSGKTGQNTGVAFANPNAHQTTTPFPSGDPSTVDYFVAAPNTITVDVDGSGNVSNVRPHTLGIFNPSDNGTRDVGGGCTETVSSHESGPS